MEELKPNYYAVIPATVRYDSDLSSTAKLLYAEITSLTNSKGYCWATNGYFMKLYNISDRQVRNLLKQLSDKKYIALHLENNKNRKIFINDTPEINFRGGGKKFPGTPEINFLHNNKMNNKKNKYNNMNDEFFDYDWLNEN